MPGRFSNNPADLCGIIPWKNEVETTGWKSLKGISMDDTAAPVLTEVRGLVGTSPFELYFDMLEAEESVLNY
jgi:hypothetical protein